MSHVSSLARISGGSLLGWVTDTDVYLSFTACSEHVFGSRRSLQIVDSNFGGVVVRCPPERREIQGSLPAVLAESMVLR